MRPFFARLMLVLAVVFGASVVPAADAPSVEPPSLDRSLVYRFDPITETFSPIEKAMLKPRHVYYRFSSVLGRWVWSKTADDGRLEFAMGPGSVQPAFLFDLTATMEERMRVLQERAPDVARLYAVQGARASMLLGDDEKWSLNGVQSLGYVRDLETGRRWEWHGDHRAEVVGGTGSPAGGWGVAIPDCQCFAEYR
jgi:hypothetical protein